MRPDEYLDVIARESAVLADAIERAGLDAAVPSCPGWTTADLAEHLGNVQRWVTRMVDARATARIDRTTMTETPAPDDLLAWLRGASADLVATLGRADPDAEMWTFDASTPTVSFWFRRQAHEVTLHRWDAESASGTPSPIGTAVAADGIGEWLDIVTIFGAALLPADGETVHLHGTDTSALDAGEWLVTCAPGGASVAPVHAKGDVAARGTASDLELYLWGRAAPSTLEVFGDADLLERLRAAGTF
jgi:uncharacterized protein (TIGR03083 family)